MRGMGNMNNMMRQMQKMQKKMMEAQEELLAIGIRSHFRRRNGHGESERQTGNFGHSNRS